MIKNTVIDKTKSRLATIDVHAKGNFSLVKPYPTKATANTMYHDKLIKRYLKSCHAIAAHPIKAMPNQIILVGCNFF